MTHPVPLNEPFRIPGCDCTYTREESGNRWRYVYRVAPGCTEHTRKIGINRPGTIWISQ